MVSKNVASFAWAASAERWRGSTAFLMRRSSPASSRTRSTSRKPCFMPASRLHGDVAFHGFAHGRPLRRRELHLANEGIREELLGSRDILGAHVRDHRLPRPLDHLRIHPAETVLLDLRRESHRRHDSLAVLDDVPVGGAALELLQLLEMDVDGLVG